MSARPLAFRYLYKSGVIKENTVTVFGELGTVFAKGTDYDYEVDLNVPYMELSNLVMYFSGTVADGTVGSSVEGSLRNLNAPVSNVRNFLKFTIVDHQNESNHYYVGDIVMFDPITTEGKSPNASCWTCIKTTTDIVSPIPELANEIASATLQGPKYNTSYNDIAGKSGPGMTGIDNRGQRFIVGVMPAVYDRETKEIVYSPYWRESTIAKSYFPEGNYYQGELVVYNGNVYQCKSTNGFSADPQLYQRTKYTPQQEIDDAIGIPNSIPRLDLELAPNGAFGYDSSGSRYVMGVPPSGGIFSGLYWEATTLPKTPSGAYLNINWDNTLITDKLQFYDANVIGGAGAQSIATFNDDLGNTITTLRKIYDDNEKSFILTVANQILSTIPAAAIKSQSVSSKVQPDNTLVELVHLGPSNSKPSDYTPAVQGLFEEAVARDMLRIAGYENTIQEILVTDGSSGYTVPPSVDIIGGLATNPKLVPYYAKADAKLGITSVKINKQDPNWNNGKRYAVGDILTFDSATNPTIACVAKVYRINSAGNILSIIIINKGSGYKAVPTVRIAGAPASFLEPVLEVVSVDLEHRDTGFVDNMKVVISYGSGSGAIGYAVTNIINGVTRLTEVRFSNTPIAHPNSTVTFNTNRGTNYVSGNFKKDIVALQGFVYDGTNEIPLASAKSVGVVTKAAAGAITGFEVIKNGSGYTSNPSIRVSPPVPDERENAILTGAPGGVSLTGFLAPIQKNGIYAPAVEQNGIYADPAIATFRIAENASNPDSQFIQGKAYLGLNAADIKLGGNGYSVGEPMNVTGGGIVPASFRVTYESTSDIYSAQVIDVGDGYSYDSVNVYKNEIILKGPNVGDDELRAKILGVGGGIVDLSFNNGEPSGDGFAVDDVIEVTPPAGQNFRFKVTSVGPENMIGQDAFQLKVDVVAENYAVGQVLLARSQFSSIDTIKCDIPQVFSSSQPQPIVDIALPTGRNSGIPSWTKRQATAAVSLKVGTIQIINAGTGYSLGDVIVISQPNSTGAICQAIVLALADTTIGSVGVVAVVNAGSGFDVTHSVDIDYPTTTGTPLEIGVSFIIDKIVVTDPGVGYEVVPSANITSNATIIPLVVTIKHAGESSATFLVTSVGPTGIPTLRQLSRGAGYVNGDLLAIKTADGTGDGAYVEVTGLQSRGVKSGTIIPGYRGTENTITTSLIVAQTTKIGQSNPTIVPIKYRVTKLTSPSSINSLEILAYNAGTARYTSPSILSHKPHAVVEVGTVDSTGSILSLNVVSSGYGYNTLPKIKPFSTSKGIGASLFAVSLGVYRVEFTGTDVNIIRSSDLIITGNGVLGNTRKRGAAAIANLAGDLNTISTDGLKNPNILETLELLKPGSTNGYAQAKPNMGVGTVNVIFAGRGYDTSVGATTGVAVTYVDVTPPDLPNGVPPTFDIIFDSLQGIQTIRVLDSGRGYSKLPKALIKDRSGAINPLPASISLNMVLKDGYVTSGGEGYLQPPLVRVSEPDLNPGSSTTVATASMKTSINGFNIENTGAQYLTNPEALVVGPGNGGEANAVMGVSEIFVVNGGTGYSVGDMLQISAPTGTSSGNSNAIATVLAVTSAVGATPAGTITRVGLVRSLAQPTVAALSNSKNDFILNGGSGYISLPTISSTLKVPNSTVPAIYGTDDSVNTDLVDSIGSGAIFSSRLGVKRINFTAAGDFYESDATVIVQSPPSSQVANISSLINFEQLSDYVIKSTGSGYTGVPAVSIDGSGSGAAVTPIMGVTEVAILDEGKNYKVGDVVTFTGGNATEAATGVVTVIDRGGNGIGYNLNITVGQAIDSNDLTVDANGNLSGANYGSIVQSTIIEGGYDFELGDIITLKPEIRKPEQAVLNSIRAIGGSVRLSGGKLTKMLLINDIASNDFKAGHILKVTSTDATLAGAVAYIRINVVLDDISGTGWHSVNNQYDMRGNLISYGSYISSPGNKYGQLVPSPAYDYENAITPLSSIGISGEQTTVIASNDLWGVNPAIIGSNNLDHATVQKLNFEVITQGDPSYPNSTAYFKVTQILSSVGAVIEATPCNANGLISTFTGQFYSVFDLNEFTGIPRGRLSFVQILNPGKGYQSMPTVSIANATILPAKLIATLGVVELTINSRGSGYTSAPIILVESPRHRAATAKAYARSGVFDIDGVDSFEVIDQGTGYTGEFLDNAGNTVNGGTYQLVGGALHATGGSAESIDTVLTIERGAFVNGKLSLTIATIQQFAATVIRGSNYRVGDLLKIVAINNTTSGNLATPATIRVTKIIRILDTNNGFQNNADYGTGAGILDYAKKENGEDVGGYGTGYFDVPRVRILGGNQGVTLSTSLGLVAVDIQPNLGDTNFQGSDYQVGDLIQMISPEFSDPVDIGLVSKVSSVTGSFLSASLYQPYTKGLNSTPSVFIKRKDPTYRAYIRNPSIVEDAVLLPVLGIATATTTTSADGFIGRPYVFVEPPNGRGFIQQPTSARIIPILIKEVDKINISYIGPTPEYNVSVPLISIDPPPYIDKYPGWRSVRFNKGDSFEAIVQYTIAKAISFQVDPDTTLPSYYITADSITIGGVVIPLRKSGGKGMQGRELSSNRIIRRYKVKLIAV